jgi:hypothetical protein
VLADIAALRELGATNAVQRPGQPSVSTDEVINPIQFAAEEALPTLHESSATPQDTTVTVTSTTAAGGETALTSSV